MPMHTKSQVRGTSGFPVLRFIFVTVFIAGFLYGFVDFSSLWTKLPPLPGSGSANSSEASQQNNNAQPAENAGELPAGTGNDTTDDTFDDAADGIDDQTPADDQSDTQPNQEPPYDLRLDIDLTPNEGAAETDGDPTHTPVDSANDSGENEKIAETDVKQQPVPQEETEPETAVENKDPERDLFTYTEREPEPDQEITDADVKRADELLAKAKELMRQWIVNRSRKAMAEAYKLLQQCQHLYRRAQARNPSDNYIKGRIQRVNELLYIAMKHVTIPR